jgi:O-antigen ligase
MNAQANHMKKGMHFGGRAESATGSGYESPRSIAAAPGPNSAPGRSSHKLAFAGLFVFTLLLYARPQELFSQSLGELPLVKLVALGTLVAYVAGKSIARERLTIWPLEVKMLALIVVLGIVFTPIAFRPERSVDMLTDTFLKVIIIFILMINLLNTKERLHSMMRLVVFCGLLIALITIKNYFTGELDVTHVSRTGHALDVGEFFDNSNELALTLDLIMPFAVVFAVIGKGLARIAYSACAALMAIGAIITFSRGGFLGLVSMGGVLLWKLGRGKRMSMTLAALVLAAAFACMMPSGYSDRIFTILHPKEDTTNSAQERQLLLERGLEVALHHPIIGIGMANFYEYSPNGRVAHNSYLEVASELGVAGLIAYLTFLIAPFRSLKRVERETLDADERARELYCLSVGLQAVMIAFMVCSFFVSTQYFWHPYYIVGYSIALRRIHASEFPIDQPDAAKETAARITQGALWKITRTARSC